MAAHDKFDPELWETRSGWRLLDEELRLTPGGFWDAWCWHFAPDSVRIAHPRRWLEPDESHVSCVFEDPFLRMARTEGMIRREGATMCSWVLWGHVVSVCSFAVFPLHLWVHALVSLPYVLFGLQVRMSLDFVTRSCYVFASNTRQLMWQYEITL